MPQQVADFTIICDNLAACRAPAPTAGRKDAPVSISYIAKTIGESATLKLNETAAILRAKLPYLKTYNAMRAENAQAYLDTICRDSFVKLPIVDDEEDSPCWHQFAIETDNRDSLRKWLAEHGVETMVHYPEPPYDAGWHIASAEYWCATTLSLPVAPHVRPNECQRIGELVNEWIHLPR